MELTDELLSYWERLAEENNNYRLSLHIETLKEIREIKALLKGQTEDYDTGQREAGRRKGRLGGKMELQKLTIGDNKLYLDGVEIKNVKEFTLKSSAMAEAELEATLYVSLEKVLEVDNIRVANMSEEKTVYFQDEIVAMKKALSIAIEKGNAEEIASLSTAIANLTKAGADIELQISY